ncbi:TIR domain-containing protein [Limnobacter sp.]|uniref:TIR domain-containing protein n=2 Tax=Limnobacter TaxID=131079 RepID=UPI0035301318
MNGTYGNQFPGGLLSSPMTPRRRKVFVSYHHGGDQAYYDEFSRFFHVEYEAVRDNSLQRIIQSNDTEYVMRQIREQYITGTSCTIVLIGEKSHERKYLDWEIKATLDKCHGLVGVVLPIHAKNSAGEIIVPDRFLDNVKSGYAVWTYWQGLTINDLTQLIDTAILRPSSQINNIRPLRQRNG